MSINKVLYNVDQRNDTSENEKATARANIGAQGALTAGSNITISNGVISAANTEYQAGQGLTLSNNTFAVDDTVLQGKLTAGANIQLNGNTISATDTTYTAGSNVQISSENVISATDTTYTAGTGLDLNGTQFSVDTSEIQEKLTAGTNIQINGNTISATDTTYTAGSNVQISSGNVISATDTTYSAGSGLALDGTEFSNTAPNVQSDWNAAAGSASEILNKPTIPTVNDGTLTIQKNGTSVATFSANQSSAATANITVPIDTSDLTNGAGFITASQVPAQVNADWDATSGAAEILHKPTIPTVNDGTLTIQKNGTPVATFSANQSSAATANITVPTDTSDLTNGAGFITASSIPAQVNADWTSSSGVSQILHKPTIAKKPYGGSETELTSLVIDADDIDGFTHVMCDNGSWGKLVSGPYATLLNSGIEGVGDSATPVYINSSGQFDACSIPNAEFIRFNYSNTTTPQDDVYAAIAAAYTNGKLPVLTCQVAGGALYWVPTATGQTSYAFARHTSSTCFTAEFDHAQHILTLAQKSIVDYTAGTNVSIDANNQISATDTTYTAGSYININSSNVISNTMHLDTAGLMVSYNTLANAGVTTHTFGPWRIQLTKRAMATWDDGTGTDPSIYVQVAHSDYISGTITNGRIQHVVYYAWKDGTMDAVYTGHVQWPFTGAYAQGGSNNGFPIDLTSPMDPDGNARACPRSMRCLQLTYNCGIDSPDWLELNIEPLYVNNNTSLTSNAARLLIRAKYFYV